MRFLISFLLFFLGFLSSVSSQQQNTANDWYFGYNAGIKFEYGVPHGVTGGALYTEEGCATVGDENGDLLFYTDGETVYNRNHQIMLNGSGLLGSWSATSAAIIIPYPHSDSLFYIFTTDMAGNHLQNGLRYSIVDMSLDGGLGGITSTKNILLETPVTEKLTAVLHQNLIYVWLVAHRWNSNEFISYLITDTGLVDTPIVSAVGSIHQGGASSWPPADGYVNAAGYLNSNSTGTQLALAIYRENLFELFDFDNGTGIVSNCHTSPANYPGAYGVEFSPNGTKLYVTQVDVSNIYQFDITQPSPFSNPIHIASPTYQPSAIKVGPNGKLYVSENGNSYLSVINNPNALGLNCDYQSNAVYLEGQQARRGLPTLFYYKGFKYISGSEVSETICQGDSVNIYGIYYSTNTEIHDTIHIYSWKDSIVNIYVTVNPSPNTPTISENSGILTSTYANNYQWYLNGNPISGANSQNYFPTQTGNYQVEVVNSYGCLAISDTLYFIYVSNNNIYIKNNSICIFPNPSTGIFNLENENFNEIQVLSLEGKVLKTYNDFQHQDNIVIDLNNLPKGLYILKFKQEKTNYFRKIVVE